MSSSASDPETSSKDASAGIIGAFRGFRPILAGATLRDRLLACLGALLCVAATGGICSLWLGNDPHLPLLVAPMGASALLLFAVPASPMAQPWPIIGGNVLSALTGLVVARFVPDHTLAAGLAVAGSIAVMSITRCLHPPGGAAALTAALGGPVVASYGLVFPLMPVGVNALVLTLLGMIFHRLAGHAYPHRPVASTGNQHGTSDPPPRDRVGFNRADIDAALADVGEAFDIGPDDLEHLLKQVELRALQRSHGVLACADIMSRDVISVPPEAAPAEARDLLLHHEIRTLPVMGSDHRLLGCIGLRELQSQGASVAEVMSPAATAAPEKPVLDLLPMLTDGLTHAVVIVTPERRVVGMVTQTDLLATLFRPRPFS